MRRREGGGGPEEGLLFCRWLMSSVDVACAKEQTKKVEEASFSTSVEWDALEADESASYPDCPAHLAMSST